MDVKKSILKSDKGQALFEFVMFLPFLVMIYSVVMSIGNSINGSINQQKATRSYFKNRLQNNSNIPKPSDAFTRLNEFGMWAIGWAEELQGSQGSPIMTCYKFSIPLGSTENDECKKRYRGTTTQFIRVGTVIGVCGASYKRIDTGVKMLPIESPSELSSNTCYIK